MSVDLAESYRGRLAPSPTGLLHLGHARTSWIAAQRAIQHGGQLILRNEDLDGQRCRPEFVRAMLEDLRWLGVEWSEGPDCGGPFSPYSQSEGRAHYLAAWKKSRARDDLSVHLARGEMWPRRRRRLTIRTMSRYIRESAGRSLCRGPLGFAFAGRTRRPSLHGLCTPHGLGSLRG
jgi:glutamyl/glutaminyl-tRNA synthetase